MCTACPSGQQCDAGACSGCNAMSCSGGCCTGSTCSTPTALRCGINGGVCSVCDTRLADGCDGGSCRCGAAAPCATGQRCAGGQCVCDSTTCPNGCCSGATCTTPALGACGIDGGACATCNTVTSDSCRANGQCGCGNAAPCQGNQQCVSGACRCTPTSCPNGCCSGDTCIAPPVVAACGIGGGMCSTCDAQRSNSCDAGQCGCGAGAACVAGQVCNGGICVCNPSSCPTGCCAGNACVPSPTFDQCGASGMTCMACAANSNSCSTSGNCQCGNGPPCPGLCAVGTPFERPTPCALYSDGGRCCSCSGAACQF
jgi:hypothetical protein